MFKKLICIMTFSLLANTFAQIYDLPIMFIDTKQKCLNYNVTKKLPATIKVLDGKTNNVADSSKGTQYNIRLLSCLKQKMIAQMIKMAKIRFLTRLALDADVSATGEAAGFVSAAVFAGASFWVSSAMGKLLD